MYLEGSLALGDFTPGRSDIDFVVVTDADVSDAAFAALQAMHARLATDEPRWAPELDGSYIARPALRGDDPRPGPHPLLDRGSGTLARVRPETGYWVIHRHIVREHGIALAGPPAATLIDPVEPDELRRAVLGLLREWWAPMLTDPGLLQRSVFGYRCYTVLTMCRTLYTLEHGTIVTKPVAARWALRTLAARWHPLIQAAQAWAADTPPDLSQTLALIAHVCDQCPR
jgi:hypothetical protein